MDNQHRLIQTYRELNEKEIGLMNDAKVLEARVLEMQRELLFTAQNDLSAAKALVGLESQDGNEPSQEALAALESAEQAVRSASIAKTELQTGFMWLVRSIARPSEPRLKKPECNCGPDEACSDCPPDSE